jgi:hypothetical protein
MHSCSFRLWSIRSPTAQEIALVLLGSRYVYGPRSGESISYRDMSASTLSLLFDLRLDVKTRRI